MIIKVSDMRDPDNIRAIEDIGVDWIGFNFNPLSERYVASPPSYLPKYAKRIGVFKETSIEEIIAHIEKFQLDGIQLDGQETTGFCHLLRKGIIQKGLSPFIIKRIDIFRQSDIRQVIGYEKYCNYFQLEIQCHTQEKTSFYNEGITHYPINTPFLISGGITPNSKKMFNTIHHPAWIGINIDYHFEIAPGIKDVALIEHFIQPKNVFSTNEILTI